MPDYPASLLDLIDEEIDGFVVAPFCRVRSRSSPVAATWRLSPKLMPFVSITRLRVRSWRYLPGFLIQSFRAARQAKLAAGSLAVSVLRDADRAFWTGTVWRNEAAMRSFMRSGVHRRIMARLP